MAASRFKFTASGSLVPLSTFAATTGILKMPGKLKFSELKRSDRNNQSGFFMKAETTENAMSDFLSLLFSAKKSI